MKNYLLAINNDLQDYYDKLTKGLEPSNKLINDFVDNTIALLDYYVDSIFKNGKYVIAKKLNKKPIHLETDSKFINSYKENELEQFGILLTNALKNCFPQRTSDKELYNDLIEIIVANCIKLFKTAQLIECLNNSITEVNLISNVNNSCPSCQTLSKFKHNVNDLIKNIDNLHPFCQLIIDPIFDLQEELVTINDIEFFNIPKLKIDLIKNLINKLKLSVPTLITNKKFIFSKNIFEEPQFADILTQKYQDNIEELKKQLDNNILSFEIDNLVLIQNTEVNNLQYIIVEHLLKDNLLNNDLLWWKDEYYKKQQSKYIGDKTAIYSKPFISYIAEQDYESYYLESAIYYILNPNLLKTIDPENYNRLKECVFHNIEFLRGC